MQLVKWTPFHDETIIRMRQEQKSWDTIAYALNLGRDSVRNRGYNLGRRTGNKAITAPVVRMPVRTQAPEAAKREGEHRASPALGRLPLPPGHPMTWGAIIRGTMLEGMPYPYQVREDLEQDA